MFEIRETTRPILPEANGDVANGAQETEPGELEAGEEIEEDYFDTGPSEVRSNAYASYLAHSCREYRSSMRHCANFTSLPDTNSTGRSLGSRRLRTIESSVDGLDRLIVSFKDAKVGQVLDCADIRWLYWNGLAAILAQYPCTRTSGVLKWSLGYTELRPTVTERPAVTHGSFDPA